MVNKVQGIYSSSEEASRVVEKLRDRGHPRHNVIVVVNDTVNDHISGHIDATVKVLGKNHSDEVNRSFWDSIKNIFTSDDATDAKQDDESAQDKEKDPIYPYRDEIKEGKILVLLRNVSHA